jgi:signal peptidase I
LNLKSDSLLKTRAKRSSSETLFKRSAPDTDRNGVWINGARIFPELISDLLTDGYKVKFRAPGDSMYPTIRNGDVVTVMPIETASITIGDIILYRHKSGVTAHRVVRTFKQNEEDSGSAHQGSQDRSLSETLNFILRGDAAVVFDDPVSADQILGKLIFIEREGRRINPYTHRAIIRYKARSLAGRFKKFVFFQRN